MKKLFLLLSVSLLCLFAVACDTEDVTGAVISDCNHTTGGQSQCTADYPTASCEMLTGGTTGTCDETGCKIVSGGYTTYNYDLDETTCGYAGGTWL